MKFHNNDVSSIWTKEWCIRSSPLEVFFKKGVLQIRRKFYTQASYIRFSYSVNYTKIPEDSQNINIEENKHESWSRLRTASRKSLTFFTKSSIWDFAVVVEMSLFRMGYSLATEVEKEAPNRMNILHKESFSQPFSENSTISLNRLFLISYVNLSRWLLP